MDNKTNINRLNYSKYQVNKNNLNNTNYKFNTFSNNNIPINRKIQINDRNNPKENMNNANNLILTRNFNLNDKTNNYISNNNSKNLYDKNNLNNTNNIRKNNHSIFTRVEMKNSNTNINAGNNNNNSTNKTNYFASNKYQNFNNNIKANNNIELHKFQTPILDNQNTNQKMIIKQIPHAKSFQSNYIKRINNKENLEKNKADINNTNALKSNNRFKINIIKPDLINEIKEDNKREEDINLMDIVNSQKGIMNIGNTCFINSSLQIFIHCPLFIYKLISKEKLINENTPITSNFISICDLMLKAKVKYISIHAFKGLLGIKHKIFSGYMQNDSQEFSRIFLEDISQELNEIKINSMYRLLSNSDSKSKKMRDRDFHENFCRREKSIITDIFYAQIVNIYTCTCKSMIFSFQKILDFPLLFPEKVENNMISLYELLKLYFATEYVEFETKCEKCRKVEKHKKELKISRPPEILILSLQRVNLINGKKLKYKVNFSQELDLYEFIDHDCGYDKESKYYLFGIINHKGSIDSGHYFSYIKNENNEWIEYNDSKVNIINNFPDSSDAVYVLFYIKEKYNNSSLFKK